MKLKGDSAVATKALDAPDPALRLILLHGADVAGSEALAARFASAMGAAAERIDIEASALDADPSLLGGEAASFSMFGDRRWIRVRNAGDSALGAVEALMASPRGDPVLMIAGKLAKNSKLLALAEGHKEMLAIVSYPQEGRDAEAMVARLAHDAGVTLPPELARRLVALCGSERGLIASEIDKLALYLDADPARPAAVTAEAMDALAAEGGEQQLFKAASIILSGRLDAAQHEIARQRQSGGSLAGLLRLTLQRAVTMAQTRAGIGGGGWQGGGRDADASMWTDEALGRAINRLAEAERTSRTVRGIGEVSLAQELFTVARLAARRR